MKRLKSITIVFENCESCELKANMIMNLSIMGIREEKSINCYYNNEVQEDTMKECELFILDINEKGLNQKVGFDNISLKERLMKWKDITYVELHYSNKQNEIIYVPWNEDNDYKNKYQGCIENLDNIRIRIKK